MADQRDRHGIGAYGPDALLALSSGELSRIACDLRPSGAAHVEALRSEASRHYSTNASQARKVARRAVELAILLDDPLALGWGHRTMAEALLFSGRMRDAEASYARAADALRSARRSDAAGALLGQLLVGRIHVLSLLGRREELKACAREARKLLEDAGDLAYLAKLAMNMGNTLLHDEEPAPALREYDRARALFRELELRDHSVLGLETNRGIALTQLDRDEEALGLFNELETECGALGFDLLRAQVRMNAAYVHSQRAEFDRALRALSEATSYFRDTEHPSFLSACELNRAEIYYQLNLHEEVLRLTDNAAPRFGRQGLRHDQAIAVAQGALSLMARGDVEEALPRIRRARTLFERESSAPRVAVMRLLSAEAFSMQGRRARALREAREARKAFRALGLVRWEASAAVLAARVDMAAEGRAASSATAHATRLRALLRRLPSRIYPIAAFRALETLGDAQARSGQTRRAESTYRRALLHLEDLRIRIPTEDSKVAFLGDKTWLYDRLLSIELDKPRPSPDRLLDWMERSRAQSLWDRLRTPDSYLGSECADGSRDGIRRRLAWLHTRLSRLELGSKDERAQIPALRRRLAQAEGDWSRWLREQEESRTYRRPGVASRPEHERDDVTHEPAPRLEMIQRALPDRWGFLTYHLGPDFSLALAVTQGGVVWRRLAGDLAARLTRLADRLDFQWGAAALSSVRSRALLDPEPPSTTSIPTPRSAREETGPMRLLRNSTDAILREMHGLLWQPMEEIGIQQGLNWIVSPHGAIHRLPLHAMLGPRGYRIEDGDLAMTPSARVWWTLPGIDRSGRRAYVAGVISPQLPAVGPEVARVATSLEGWEVARDLAPTRPVLRDQGLVSDLLHLAAHGSLRKDNPAYSFIELSDGPLFVHDLAGFRLPRSTVVLTACSSGRGAAPSGDEWIGLARGFLSAGASTVVASLWPIQDEPTLTLMDRFYAAYRRGLGPAAALGEAMRQSRALLPHPWHWASFACLGGVAPRKAGSC